MLLTLAACTADTAEPQGSVRFTSAACPADVVGALPDLRVTCGYLTAPELHAHPEGGTVEVFVARVRGPEPVPSDPLIVIGGKDIGAAVHYADDIAPMPARVGREIIVLEPRGTGHDRPALTCPEVERFDEDHVGGSLADADVESVFSEAVTACASSLRDRGVELSAFTLRESAADVGDLVTALGLDAFNVATYGYNSKIAFELLRRAPAGLRSVYMDSPV
ncbi:MAG: hypothetical protein H0W82_09340, partial [Actinobacteria bacterium]|nr:hypothetical protein [Actinomycetota bacterium]